MERASLKICILVGGTALATALVGIGVWADKKEQARFGKAERVCLEENYCKKTGCAVSVDFDADEFLAKLERTKNAEPRKFALPDEMPKESFGQSSAEARLFWDAEPDECQRPPSSDWKGKTAIAAGVVVVPWGLLGSWLLVLAMIRSIAKAIREGSSIESGKSDRHPLTGDNEGHPK